EPVQGFAGLGTPGNQFAGSFLRYADGDLFDMALTLTDLPAHDTLTLGFLLAVIDSWDGTELLEVTVDDMVVFSHSFELATTDTSSYVPPEGGLLSSGTDLERDAEAVAEDEIARCLATHDVARVSLRPAADDRRVGPGLDADLPHFVEIDDRLVGGSLI